MDKNLPLQSFDEISDAQTVAPHLTALRGELRRRGLDGFIAPRADEHQGEYVPAAARRLAWLTAFTGSAGAAVVLGEKGALFVDGRYTLQARAQTDTARFEPRDLVAEGPDKWIAAQAARGAKIGYDPWLHTPNAVARLKKAAAKAGAEMVACDGNPIDAVWTDRPAPPTTPAVPHPFELCGETSADKRGRIAETLKRHGADALVLTMPDSICWLFNIRGADVPYTPFTLGFAILRADASAALYLDGRKVTPELIAHLGSDVRVQPPEALRPALQALGGKSVAVDPATAAAAIFDALDTAGATILRLADPCQVPKACKNPVEVEGARKAHIRDGAAMVNFLAWFSREAPKGMLTEISAAEKLEACRKATGSLTDLSFDSISAAAAHAAMPHYHVTRSSCLPIKPGDVYLIDSGGQYPDGTTDITRTVIVGTPTAEMKDRNTRVLKGHIALASAVFPDGTLGVSLDALARRPLWEVGIDFNHGTGHGVGSYLSVHEGPHRISKNLINQAMLPGMVVSDEPGYYKEGAFGIRIENLLTVRRRAGNFEWPMLEFETLTLCPIDTALIAVELLTPSERDWLNAYHQRVRETLIELVEADARDWLTTATRAI
jgi:Xaa-Pro aminopeptidase